MAFVERIPRHATMTLSSQQIRNTSEPANQRAISNQNKEMVTVKQVYCYISLLVMLCYLQPARAQSSFDARMGFGTATNSASGSGIDNINSPNNAFGSCSLLVGDPFCQATPSLGGFFMGFGGDAMLEKQYGLGAEFTFQPRKNDYGPLQYRQLFYDFHGIYAPLSVPHASLLLLGGIGGSRTSFSLSQSACIGTAVCTTQATAIGHTNHFQMHVAIGVQLLLTQRIFIQPQLDLHYVPGFTDQFGRNTVPGATVWIGYHFGGD